MKLRKYVIVPVLAAILAIGITGCTTAQGTAPVAGNEEVMVTFNQGSVNRTLVNDELLNRAGMQVTLDLVDKAILDEVVPVTEAMTEKIEASLENIKAYYKDNFENSLIINGFDSEEAFKRSMYLNEQRAVYTTQYIVETSITPEDVKAYYDGFTPQIEASHILITPKDETEEASIEAEKIANELIVRIENGEDFATLAKEFSDDQGSGANGGALGAFGKGQMVPEFETAAYALNNNETSKEPVKSQFGFHIINRTGGGEKLSLEAMTEEINTTLAEQLLQADQKLGVKALVKLREDNGISIANTTIANQYKLFSDEINKEVTQ